MPGLNVFSALNKRTEIQFSFENRYIPGTYVSKSWILCISYLVKVKFPFHKKHSLEYKIHKESIVQQYSSKTKAICKKRS